jgi:hypothetical protein
MTYEEAIQAEALPEARTAGAYATATGGMSPRTCAEIY